MASIALQPPSVFLIGPPGTGKTYSLTTFVEAGLELFVIGTEPNAADSLLDSAKKRNLDVSKIHFHAVTPAPPDWQSMVDVAEAVQKNSFEGLKGQKTGIAKSRMTHWIELLKACKDYPDDISGKAFGDVTQWDANRALVIDSLSGLNVMAREFTVGLAPSMAQGEWGTAMELEGGLVRKLVSDRGSFFTLVAHIDRNVDEVTQATKLMPAALGNKLAPQMMKMFSEIVLAKRIVETGKPDPRYEWSTLDPTADLKNRGLAASASLPASFVPLVEAHRRRVAQSAAST